MQWKATVPSPYEVLKNCCFLFQKKFKREDVARALVVTLCRDIVMTSHLVAMTANAKHIYMYLIGSLVSNELIRDIMTSQFAWLKVYRGEVIIIINPRIIFNTQRI